MTTTEYIQAYELLTYKDVFWSLFMWCGVVLGLYLAWRLDRRIAERFDREDAYYHRVWLMGQYAQEKDPVKKNGLRFCTKCETLLQDASNEDLCDHDWIPGDPKYRL